MLRGDRVPELEMRRPPRLWQTRSSRRWEETWCAYADQRPFGQGFGQSAFWTSGLGMPSPDAIEGSRPSHQGSVLGVEDAAGITLLGAGRIMQQGARRTPLDQRTFLQDFHTYVKLWRTHAETHRPSDHLAHPSSLAAAAGDKRRRLLARLARHSVEKKDGLNREILAHLDRDVWGVDDDG
jgi:hypothetical protein